MWKRNLCEPYNRAMKLFNILLLMEKHDCVWLLKYKLHYLEHETAILEEEVSLCFRYLKTVMIEYCFTKLCFSTNWVWSKEIVAIDNFIFHFHIWWKAIEFHLRPQGKRKGSMIFINIIKYFLDWKRKGIQSRTKNVHFFYIFA